MPQVAGLSAGDVIHINYYDTVKGHEQQITNTRPCLVFKVWPNHDLLWILPITSKQQTPGISIVNFAAGFAGLQNQGFVLIHQLRVISAKRIKSKVGSLTKFEFAKVTAAFDSCCSQ